MSRFSYLVFLSLLAGVINIAGVQGLVRNRSEFYTVGNAFSMREEATAAISATITGTTQVCPNATKPGITFTGSGGTAPYTFTYHINGGGDVTVTSTSGKDNVVIQVNTDVPGSFIYTLTNVADARTSQSLNEQATVTVSAMPTVDFTFTDNQCLGAGVLFTPSLTGTYKYAWSFGDGATSTKASPTHQYAAPGTGTQNYPVKLIISDSLTSCQNSVSKIITVNKVPDATLSGSGSGTTFNGIPCFRVCSNDVTTFTFLNSSTTKATNGHYTLSWGDGSADYDATTWTSTTHTYQTGMWTLTYTVEGTNGCKNIGKYYVFVGSNPAVTLENPGNTNICISQTLTFKISGTEYNSQGTMYTVYFNDGSPNEVLPSPTPASITHKFKKSSCGITSSDGSTIYQNSFSVKIIASNPCGPSASSVMPIYVSVPPTADFIVPSAGACTNTPVCFTNSSKNGNAINGGSCSTNSNLIWKITPSTGYTLQSGSYGNDFGGNEPSLWSSGTNAICPVFTSPGVYTISMKIGNRCDIDSIKKTICVEALLVPQFDLSASQGCAPFNVAVTNKTDTTGTCSPAYNWTVAYTANYCGNTPAYTFTSGTSASSFNPSFRFTNPGIYTIQFTATNSCGSPTAAQTVTVTMPPAISIDSIVNYCETASVHPVAVITNCAPATSAMTYAWSFPGGSPGSSTSADQGTIAYSAAGNYAVSLIVTNECGISAKAVRTFVVHPLPVITNTVLSQTVCSGFRNDSIPLTSNSPLVTYSWTATAIPGITGFTSSGTTSKLPISQLLNFTNVPGTVTFAITPFIENCVGTVVNYVITVDPAPIIASQPKSFQVCVGDTPDTLSVAATNGTGVPTYQWYRNTVDDNTTGDLITGATNPTYLPSTGTVDTLYYYCIVTYPSGECSSLHSETAQVIISAYPVLSTYHIEINSGETFTFTPSVLNGDIVPDGTTYTWLPPVISPANSVTGASGQSTPQTVMSQTLIDLVTGFSTVTYTVTPTAGPCKGQDFNVIVTVNHPLSAHAVPKNISCFGVHDGSIQTVIEGGAPYATGAPYLVSWTGPNGFTSANPSISGLYPGIYSVTITDLVGTSLSRSDTITEPTQVILKTLTTKNVSCFGASDGEIAIQVTGGTPPYAYNWEKDAVAFTGLEDITNLGPGIYTVNVTDANGCSPGASFTITEKPQIVITLKNQINLKCFGDGVGALSVQVAGGDSIEKTPGVFGYNYSWIGPNGYKSTNQDLTSLVAGSYTLTVTDKAGCTQSLSATITQPTEMVLTVTTTPVTCYGDNNASIKVDIAGGVQPYQIQWSNLGQGTFQNNLGPGTYTISITDSNGCTKSKDIVIAETEFSIQPVVKQITCFGAHDGSIDLNLQGGASSVTMVWADDPIAGTSRNQLGAGTYTVTLTNVTSCVINRSFTIIEPLELDLTAAVTNAFDCKNPNSGAITLTISGGTQPYNIVWSNGATTKDLSNLQAGIYEVTVTDANGCVSNEQFEVIRQAPLALSVTTVPDFDCQTKVVKEVCTSQVTGGIPPYRFAWSSGTPTGLNNENMETVQSGTVTLQVTDAQGCTVSTSFNVALSTPGIGYQVLRCDTRTFGFNATIPYGLASDYSFLWNFGDGTTDTTQNPQHAFTASGTYNVSLTLTTSNCSSVFEEKVTVYSPPVLVLDKSPVFCKGDSLLLQVSGAYTYRWSNGSTTDQSLIKQAGDYSVTGTSSAGCSTTLSFKATYFDSYNFTIQTDKNDITTAGPTVQFWSENVSSSDYFWNFGDGQSAEGNNQNHTYTITQNGYYDVTLQVKTSNGCTEFATKRIWIAPSSIPNVFTPNGDGIDDLFMQGWHIQVYNRNGISLYDGTGGWDGTYKGKYVSNDTYFYVLYPSTTSGIKARTGYVTVVR